MNTSRAAAAKIAIPRAMAKLDRTASGLPIPFGVLRDAEGAPNFSVSDTAALLDAMTGGLCILCGEGLSADDVWFVGTPCEALDPRGAYASPPKHHACATYAMQVCPHLALPGYEGRAARARRVVAEGLAEDSPLRALIDVEAATTRPDSFMMARADGYLLAGTFPDFLITIPNRPLVEVEEWRHGERIMRHRTAPEIKMLRTRGLSRLKADKLTFSHLSKAQKQAWDGKARGVFPWTDQAAFMEHIENTSRKPRL